MPSTYLLDRIDVVKARRSGKRIDAAPLKSRTPRAVLRESPKAARIRGDDQKIMDKFSLQPLTHAVSIGPRSCPYLEDDSCGGARDSSFYHRVCTGLPYSFLSCRVVQLSFEKGYDPVHSDRLEEEVIE